jgi:hypothetical protein
VPTEVNLNIPVQYLLYQTAGALYLSHNNILKNKNCL